MRAEAIARLTSMMLGPGSESGEGSTTASQSSGSSAGGINPSEWHLLTPYRESTAVSFGIAQYVRLCYCLPE